MTPGAARRPAGRRTARAVVVAALTGLVALTACTPPDGLPRREPDVGGFDDAPSSTGFATLADVEAQPLAWGSCGNGAECADVIVPLDYDDVAGQGIRLALKRLPATGEARGTILVNPGGPGESGVELVDAATAIFGSEVLAKYDVVGFDPRGVGSSTQVRCLEPGEEDPTAVVFDLDDPASVEEMRTAYAQLGQRCTELSGALLDHVDTEHAARDLDVLRALVGDEQLTYVGYSYGTLLGAVYAGLFPERVGRLVLDSGIDPALGYADLQSQQLDGFDDVFAAFVEQCQDEPACPLAADPDEAAEELLDVVAELDSDPLGSDAQDGELAGWELLYAVQGAMYTSDVWPDLVTGLADVVDGEDGSLVDEIGATGALAGSDDPNYPFAYPAVDCTDYPVTSDVEEALGRARDLEASSPLFGEGSVGELACVLWPAKATVVREPIAAEGAAPILVVSALRDPATPHAWSVALADQLSSGRLLSYDGEGHAIYGGVSPCVDEAVDAYLLTGELPAEGTVCG
ncbi:hypothetical protein C8046_08305 [Serinibacter arcticus]|uniref:Peptidase S33 tripeptidyl aminopeptidase-like C-terminal domain-containing protein n=1 Tax=Serinibacter arcticus TaxID=1655435 RepID=A0A2U1ZUJ8_9MICO|nr:alpha/beta hydrolase [Serinibacter arcticus]PWD50656.1 hypothetical protein C8046_08305 [Serinibacter arcticus]